MERVVILLSVGLFVWGIIRLKRGKKFPVFMCLMALIMAIVGTSTFHVTNRHRCELSVAQFLQTHSMRKCNLTCQLEIQKRESECQA